MAEKTHTDSGGESVGSNNVPVSLQNKRRPKENKSNGTELNIINQSQESNDMNPMYQFIDFSEEFLTTESFESREEMVNWVYKVGIRLNMNILVRRSDSGASGRRARVFLGCERGGKYRPPKKRLAANSSDSVEQKPINKRFIGTKKCDCPFMLKGLQVNELGHWCLEVVCGLHNHPIDLNLAGHSFAGRPTSVEDQLVRDLSINQAKPKDILSTLKTVYNVRQKHRIVQHRGRTQMQYLLGKLKEEEYYHLTRRCEVTDRVIDLFYAHPTSIELLRAFPSVLLMDCTYKTNRYKMPLLEIVGVTSTNITFSVACVYLEKECEENYRWALSTLDRLMVDGVLPKVIVTNREIALMNAIDVTFPTSRHLLCRWHINKNVLAKCRGFFGRAEKWECFMSSWNMLIVAEDEPRFNELLRRFLNDYADMEHVVNYCMKNWIEPFKKKFVLCWTNNVMHYQNTTSNRAESAHAKLKKQLGTIQSNFETYWARIHHLLIMSHTQIKTSFELSLNVASHCYSLPIFKNIRGLVSHHALGLMFEEMKWVDSCGVDPLMCSCLLKRTCGLPCAHELAKLKRDRQVIQLEMIKPFWRKLDCEPSKSDTNLSEDLRNCFIETVGNINEMFRTASKAEKLILLNKLEEIKMLTMSMLQEPAEVARPRGRPNKSKVDFRLQLFLLYF